jgi:hypothetical protein
VKIKKTLSQKVGDANRKNAQLRPGNKILVAKTAIQPGMKATKAIDNLGVDKIFLKELHERLRHKEKQLSKDAFKRLQTLFANQRFFCYPLFDRSCDESLSDPGHKYNSLLVLLRDYPIREVRLLILATWLYREGICQPEHLLGKEFLRYRQKGLRGSRGRLSLTACRQAFIVDNWKPYFERLLLARRNGLDLRRLGFDESAIQSAIGKLSARAAACDYVCSRLGVDVPALENAYSRVFSKGKKRNSGPPT